jgi:hypothetical protein
VVRIKILKRIAKQASFLLQKYRFRQILVPFQAGRLPNQRLGATTVRSNTGAITL